jgi:RHH-type transcriptional regulator, rel operon repressor / antitoxin RelB
MSSTTSVRLPSKTARRLDGLSKVLDKPKTHIIQKALEEYLEEYEDYLIAVERINDKNDRIISGKELRERLGL